MRYWFFPGLISLLAILSVLVIRSVAPTLATRQFVGFLLGLGAFVLVAKQHPSQLVGWSKLAYASLCILLVIPLLIGQTTRGIAAWIDIGTWFSIQPSQIAVPIVALLLAHYIPKHSLRQIKHVFELLIIIGIPAVLIALEPDLGTLVVYLVSLGTMAFLSDLPWKTILLAMIVGCISVVLAWMFLLQPYQKNRILSFMASDQDTKGSSYNARQAQIAVGSGQIVGRGLGQGVQSHLRFLPERQTDFIFASLAEELGFLGSTLILGLYASLVAFLAWQAEKLPDTGRLYTWAVMAMLGVQILINVGMNMGLVPITGITLPFLSYGSSSIVGMCLLLGVVQSFMTVVKPQRHFHLS